eukprot:Tamp_13781.p1 GENE.Tamp_13781~~Tamp_13781.p1  ORF type:complete len:411 (-),score=49.36 Tamp_13781:453-1550(-)
MADDGQRPHPEVASPAPKKRNLASSSFITSSPMNPSAKKMRGRPAAGAAASIRSLNADLEEPAEKTAKSSLSARARSIFSPVFSPVLNLFKKDGDKKGGDAASGEGEKSSLRGAAKGSGEAATGKLTSSSESVNTSKDSASEGSISEASTVSLVTAPAGVDFHVTAPADEEASESDPEYDDDFDDFDPFEFIKNLPLPDCNSPRPSALPKKTRTAPPVSLVLDLDETLGVFFPRFFVLLYIYIYCVCVCVCVCVCTYACAQFTVNSEFLASSTYIHACMHTYIHTYVASLRILGKIRLIPTWCATRSYTRKRRVQFQDLSGSNTLVQLELVLYVRAHIVSLRKGFQKGQKLEQASGSRTLAGSCR